VVFVLAYVATRSIRGRRTSSPEEYLVNALQELEEAALHDLQREERERALQYLRRAGSEGPLAAGLTRLVHELEEAPARPPGRMERAAADVLHAYRRLARRPVFWRAVVIFFILQVGVKLLHVGTLIVAPDGGWYPARLAFMSPRLDEYALPEWLQLGSSLLSGALVAAGIVALRRSRQTALRLFQRSILVSVFVTQVFMFYRSQWEALVVLAFNLLLLAALGYMRAHEEPEPA
jgi:hypothetical protein